MRKGLIITLSLFGLIVVSRNSFAATGQFDAKVWAAKCHEDCACLKIIFDDELPTEMRQYCAAGKASAPQFNANTTPHQPLKHREIKNLKSLARLDSFDGKTSEEKELVLIDAQRGPQRRVYHPDAPNPITWARVKNAWNQFIGERGGLASPGPLPTLPNIHPIGGIGAISVGGIPCGGVR